MAVNTYRLPGKKPQSSGFFSAIERFIRIDQTVTEVIHVKFLPQIVFTAFLCVIYIANRHYAEKNVRAINILEQQVDDLRADFTTLKADYMYASKQSEVVKKAASLGLKESLVPPEKIVLSE